MNLIPKEEETIVLDDFDDIDEAFRDDYTELDQVQKEKEIEHFFDC